MSVMTASDMGSRIIVHEVGPRDGLQNESERLSLEARQELVTALVESGLQRIEIGSLVRPDWIPQLADTDVLAQRLLQDKAISARIDSGALRFYALIPNRVGLKRAIDCGVKDVALFMSATESHNFKNTNKTIAESLHEFSELVPMALAQGVKVRAYLSCIWGCPYEGEVDTNKALAISRQLSDCGVSEISLGDTIGIGNPAQTKRIVTRFLEGSGAAKGFPAGQLALHMHDTHGTALANCLAAYELGIRIFDASIGGTGGCPYAPGAAGNLATEDLVSMVNDMGIETGVDLDKLFDAGMIAQAQIGHRLTGRRLQAALGRRAKVPVAKAAT